MRYPEALVGRGVCMDVIVLDVGYTVHDVHFQLSFFFCAIYFASTFFFFEKRKIKNGFFFC